MSQILDFISNYWGFGATAVGALGYYFTHKASATAFAKSKIKLLMLSAEKYAEQLALDNGQAKFNWVVDKGYNMLPAPVRMFVSYPMFKQITQTLFDEAIAFAKSHQVQDIPAQKTNEVPPNSSEQLISYSLTK
jgi:hypothetical protein